MRGDAIVPDLELVRETLVSLVLRRFNGWAVQSAMPEAVTCQLTFGSGVVMVELPFDLVDQT